MPGRSRKFKNKLARPLVSALVFALAIYTAFSNSGYFSGAMQAALTVFVLSSIWISGWVFYPRARKVMTRRAALIFAIRETAKSWMGYKDFGRIKKGTNANNPNKTN